jgi:hypothetical protein
MTTRHTKDRRSKTPYVPSVRPRALQPDGPLRYSPNYPDPSDTKTAYFTHAVSTTRATVATPSPGRRIRVVHIRAIHRPNTSTAILVELYFGAGASIAVASTPIDAFQVSGPTEQTRSWARGQGPRGARNEALSVRESSVVAGGNLDLIIDYTEER